MQKFAENSRNFVQILCQMRRIAVIFLALLIIASCSDRRYYKVSGYAQGGTYTIKYRGACVGPEKVLALSDSLLREIDFTLSGYNKNSLLSRLNRGDSVVLTPMFAEVYRLSYEMWELSGGAFDAACGPLFDIWGFGFKSGEMPSDAEIARVLASCGTGRLVKPDVVDSLVRDGVVITSVSLISCGDGDCHGGSAFHDNPVAAAHLPVLNFNAIAQGYSCDLVYNMLRGLGVTDMLVDIGEIRCCGFNPSGKGWSIGIDNPVDGNDKPGEDIRQIWTSDGGDYGVVTSGNYRKFYIRDGRKYSHTIDPRTGRPVEHNLLSATVIVPGHAKEKAETLPCTHPSSDSGRHSSFAAAEADALATMFMVIGFEPAREYLATRPDLTAYLITSDSLWSSK